MQASRTTAIIAQGVALWADLQDMPQARWAMEESSPGKKWAEWERRYPQFVDFVKAEQFSLFDRVNAQNF